MASFSCKQMCSIYSSRSACKMQLKCRSTCIYILYTADFYWGWDACAWSRFQVQASVTVSCSLKSTHMFTLMIFSGNRNCYDGVDRYLMHVYPHDTWFQHRLMDIFHTLLLCHFYWLVKSPPSWKMVILLFYNRNIVSIDLVDPQNIGFDASFTFLCHLVLSMLYS